MSVEEWIRAIAGYLLLAGWVSIIAFGILLYVDLRKVPKEVLGARIFLNLDKFLRGFLILSFGFLAVLLSALPARVVAYGAYIVLAGTVAWLGMTGFSLYLIFSALHVPGAVRRKFGIPASR